MYKVFIDHSPIIFITEEEKNDESPFLMANKFTSIQESILPEIKTVKLDSPLQIVSKDPEKAFELVFRDCKVIEAAGGLVRRKDEFLLIKRGGLWDIPKGKIEKGEKKKKAAVREVEEECGIKKPEITDHLVDTYHTIIQDGKIELKKTYWYMMKFKGSRKLKPQTEEGITKVKWMPMNHMMAIRGRTYGSINEVLDVFKERLENKSVHLK